jgi:uncharacterized membrane protein
MAVTVFAVLFLFFLVGLAIIGYRVLGNRTSSAGEAGSEKCSVCRERFNKEELIERQIGDYRLLYFCRKCVMGLYSDLGIKN